MCSLIPCKVSRNGCGKDHVWELEKLQNEALETTQNHFLRYLLSGQKVELCCAFFHFSPHPLHAKKHVHVELQPILVSAVRDITIRATLIKDSISLEACLQFHHGRELGGTHMVLEK